MLKELQGRLERFLRVQTGDPHAIAAEVEVMLLLRIQRNVQRRRRAA